MRTIGHLLLRFLAEDDRELLLGDIAELKLREGQAMRELSGFLLRRWLAPFRDWRVWVGATAFLGLVWMPMFQKFLPALSMPFRFWSTYERYGAIYETGLTFQQDFAIWLSQLALLLLFAFNSGYALALFSRRHIAVVAGLILTALGGWWLWLSFSFGRFAIFLVLYGAALLAPAVVGAFRYVRHGRMTTVSLVWIAFATFSLIALQAWMGGWFQEAMLVSGGDISWLHTTTWYQRIQPWLVVSCPAIFLVVERWIGVRKVVEI